MSEGVFQWACRLQAAGRLAEAERSFKQVLALDPRHAGSLNQLGVIALQTGRATTALSLVQQAIAIDATQAPYHYTLGNVFGDLRRPVEALASYHAALLIEPDYPEVFNNLGNVLKDLKRPADALASYDRAIMLRPGYAKAHSNRGALLAELDRPIEALASYDRALAIEPEAAEVHSNKGVLLADLGRLAEAQAATETAIRLAPRRTRYYYNLVTLKRLSADDPQIAEMQALAQDIAAFSIDEQISLHFALGKALSDIGDQEASFRHLAAGNALKRGQVRYDEAKTLGALQHMRVAFSTEMMRRLKGCGAPSSLPVFIVGMPRSGTSLVEQILASHPSVFGAGEIDEFEKAVAQLRARSADPSAPFSLTGEELRALGADYLDRIRPLAPRAERIVNKTMENFRFIGFIHLALPNAQIIHVRRDPIDTCVSCFSHHFKHLPYTYDLGELGRYYRAYETMMAHWRSVLPPGAMLEVSYEDVVFDLEGQAKRIVDFCGLPWNEKCLSFHQTERIVRTASKSQVREPIYSRSVGRWTALGPMLDDLFKALSA
jgi:tetratricopeptide (TPR) repeat protein